MGRRHVRITQTASRFLILCPYQPALIRAIRTIPGRRYEPVKRAWQVPCTTEALRALLRFAHEHDAKAVRRVEQALHLATLHEALARPPYTTPGWWTQDGGADDQTDDTAVAV